MIYLHKILPFFLSPLGIILIFLILSFFYKRRFFVFLAFLVLIFSSNSFVATYLFNQLEKLILEAKSSDMEDVLYDFDDFFRNTHKSIQRISEEYVTSNNLDERFSDSNIRILKTLDDINSLIYKDLNKLNLIVSESANDFISIVLIISLIGLLIGLFL